MAAPRFVLAGLTSLATPRSPAPLVGERLDEILEISDPALCVEDGRIAWVGPRSELPAEYADWPRQDGAGGTLIPGFVDPHTHLVFAGDRAEEFDRRARGAAYMEILAAGGGILDSVRRVRASDEDQLLEQSKRRVSNLLATGTTTVEIKSGYGLTTVDELKMLEVARRLGEETPVSVVSTFLGAHAVPPEHRDDPQAYLDLVCEEMLPAVRQSGLAEYVDVFCERGVFDLTQTRRIGLRARELGFGLRLHADEVHPMGGGKLAAELGARSADHLIATDQESIEAMAAAGTACTLLPGTAFVLAKGAYAPAVRMRSAGCILALATDLNPGSCHLESMPVAMQIAVTQMGLTPAEALSAGTLNAAWTLERDQNIGSLEVGKDADLALLAAPDYRHLTYRLGVNLVRRVWIRGEPVEVRDDT
jgi:imidazolonepropionase